MTISSRLYLLIVLSVVSCTPQLSSGIFRYESQDDISPRYHVLYDVEYSDGQIAFSEYLQYRYSHEWYREGMDFNQRVIIKLYFRNNGTIHSIRLFEHGDLPLPQDLYDYIAAISREAPGTWTVRYKKVKAYHCFIAVVKLY